MSNSTNYYVSSVAWAAISLWPGISSAVTLGQLIRNTDPNMYPAMSLSGNGSSSSSVSANFGASSFAMTIPSGFTAWDSGAQWDSTSKGSNIVITGSGLIATGGTAGSQNWTGNSVRANSGHRSGKWYWEITMITFPGANGNMVFGAANPSGNMGSYMGSDVNSFGFQSTGTCLELPTGGVSGWQDISGLGSSQTIGIAMDLDNGLVWARSSASTNWNNNSSNNPTTGVGGKSINVGTYRLVASNGRVFKVTTAGTTNSTIEPTWNLGNNATTSDGTAVWTQIAGHEAEQVAGNWKAPFAALSAAEALWSSGDVVIFVSDDHVDANSAAISAGTNLVMTYVSVKRTGSIPPVDADYSPGAIIETLGSFNLTIDSGTMYGFHFKCGVGSSSSALTFGIGASTRNLYLEDCTLEFATTGGFGNFITFGFGFIELVNTNLKYGSTGPRMNGGGLKVIWRDTPNAIDTGGSIPSILIESNGAIYEFKGVDLHSLNTQLYNGFPTNDPIKLIDCKINASMTHSDLSTPQNPSSSNECGFYMWNCDVAGGVNYKFYFSGNSGSIKSTNLVARAGGASNGVSYNSTVLQRGVLRQPWVEKFNSAVGSSKTVTMHAIAFGSHLTAMPDTVTCYMETEVLDDTGLGPLCSLHTTRGTLPWASVYGSGTANTADTASDWTAGAPARINSHAYTAGDFFKVSTSGAGMLFTALNSGTSASSVPGGYATAVDGGTVTDGSVSAQAGWRMKFVVTVTPQLAGIVRGRVVGDLHKNDYNQFFNLIVDPKISIA